MSLHLENELVFRIDRQKPWTSVRYKSVSAGGLQLDGKQQADVSARSAAKQADFLLLDDGALIDADNSCRASHVYRTGQSDKSLLEKKAGSRFLGVQASASGEYVSAYTKKGELVLWNSVKDTLETFPGPFISKQEVNNRTQHTRFRKATEEAYKNLTYSQCRLWVADDGQSVVLLTFVVFKGGAGASQGDLWIFHKGGFFAYQGGQWMHLLNDFHSSSSSSSSYASSFSPPPSSSARQQLQNHPTNKQEYANNFKFNVRDDEALDFGSFAACHFSSPLLGHGWRVTQTFLADAQGSPCHPQQCRGIVVNDMIIRFKRASPNLFRYSDSSAVSGVYVHSAYADSSASHFFDESQQEACDPVRETSSFYHPLSQLSLAGVFGQGKRVRHGKVGNGAVVSAWDVCATVLAVVINADHADHALVFFFELSNIPKTVNRHVASQGRARTQSEESKDVHSFDPDTFSDEEQQPHNDEALAVPAPTFYMVDLHGFLPAYESRGLESWWVNDLAWVGSGVGKSLFLALVTRGGSVVVCSRVGRPVNLTCASTRPELQANQLAAKHLPVLMRESKASARPLHFSISAHPTRPLLLVCDGLSVMELRVPVEEMTLLTMLSDPVRRLVGRAAATRRSSVAGRADNRNVAASATAAVSLSVNQILEGLYTCVAYPALAFDPTLHSVIHVLQNQVPNAIRLSTASLVRNSSLNASAGGGLDVGASMCVSESLSVDQSIDLTRRGLTQRAALTAQACVKFIYDALGLLSWQKSFQTMFLDFANLITTVVDLLIATGATDLAYSCLSDSEKALRQVFDGGAGVGYTKPRDLSFFGQRQHTINQAESVHQESFTHSSSLEVSFQFADQWKRLCSLLEQDTTLNASTHSQDHLNRSLHALERVQEKLSGFNILSEEQLRLGHSLGVLPMGTDLDSSSASRSDAEQLHSLSDLEMSFVFRGRKLYLAKRRDKCVELLVKLVTEKDKFSEMLYICACTWLISLHLSGAKCDVAAALAVADELMAFVLAQAASPATHYMFLLASKGLLGLARAMDSYFRGKESVLLPVPYVMPGNDVRLTLSGTDTRFLMVIPCRSLHASVLASQTEHGQFDKSFGEQFGCRDEQHTLGMLESGWTVRRCVDYYRACGKPRRALGLTQSLIAVVTGHMAAQEAARGETSLSNPLSNVDALVALEFPVASRMPSGKKLSLSMLAMASPFFVSDAQPLHALETGEANGVATALWANSKNGYQWTLRELLELATALVVASSVTQYPPCDPCLNDLNAPGAVLPVIDEHARWMTERWDLHGMLSLMHAHTSAHGSQQRNFGFLAFPEPTTPVLSAVFSTLRARCGKQCLGVWMDKVLRVVARLPLVPTNEFPSYYPLPPNAATSIQEEESFEPPEDPLLGTQLGDGVCSCLAPLAEPLFLGDSASAARSSPLDLLFGDEKSTLSASGYDRMDMRDAVHEEYMRVAAMERNGKTMDELRFTEEWFTATESKLQSAVLGGTHAILHVVIRLLAIKCGENGELQTKEQNPYFKDHASIELRAILKSLTPELVTTLFFLLVRQTLWLHSSTLREMAVGDSFPMHGAFGRTGSEVHQVEPVVVRHERERKRKLREDVALKCAVWALRLSWCSKAGEHFSRFAVDTQSVLLGFLLQAPTTPTVAKFVAVHVGKHTLHASQHAAYTRLLARFRMTDMGEHKSETEGMFARIVSEHAAQADAPVEERASTDHLLEQDPMFVRFRNTLCMRLVNYTLELPEDTEHPINVHEGVKVVGGQEHPEFLPRDSLSALLEGLMGDSEEWSVAMDRVLDEQKQKQEQEQREEQEEKEREKAEQQQRDALLAEPVSAAGTRAEEPGVVTPVVQSGDDSASPEPQQKQQAPASPQQQQQQAAVDAGAARRAARAAEEEAERVYEEQERARTKARKLKRAEERIRAAKVRMAGERTVLSDERSALEQERAQLQALKEQLEQAKQAAAESAEKEPVQPVAPVAGTRDIDFASLVEEEAVDPSAETGATSDQLVYYAPGTVMHGKPVTFDSEQALALASVSEAGVREEGGSAELKSALARKKGSRTVRFSFEDDLSSDESSALTTDSDTFAAFRAVRAATPRRKHKQKFTFMPPSQGQRAVSMSQVFPSVKHDRINQLTSKQESIWSTGPPQAQKTTRAVSARPETAPLVAKQQPIKLLFVPSISKHKGSSSARAGKAMVTPQTLSTGFGARGIKQGAVTGAARMLKKKLGSRPALLRVSAIDSRWSRMRSTEAQKEAVQRQRVNEAATALEAEEKEKAPQPAPVVPVQQEQPPVASPAPLAGTRDIDFSAFSMLEEEEEGSGDEDEEKDAVTSSSTHSVVPMLPLGGIMESNFVDTTVFYSSRPNSYERRGEQAEAVQMRDVDFQDKDFVVPALVASMPQTQRTDRSSRPDTRLPSARVAYAPLTEEERAEGVIPVLLSSLPATPGKAKGKSGRWTPPREPIRVDPDGVVPLCLDSMPPSTSSTPSRRSHSRLYNDETTGAWSSDPSTPRLVRRGKQRKEQTGVPSPQSQKLVQHTQPRERVSASDNTPKNYYISDIMQDVALLEREQALQARMALVQQREEQVETKADQLWRAYGPPENQEARRNAAESAKPHSRKKQAGMHLEAFMKENYAGEDAQESLLNRRPTMLRRNSCRPSATRPFIPHRLDRDQELYNKEYKDAYAIADMEQKKQLRVDKIMERIYGSELQRDQGFRGSVRHPPVEGGEEEREEETPFQRQVLPASVIGPRSGALMYMDPARMRGSEYEHVHVPVPVAEADDEVEDEDDEEGPHDSVSALPSAPQRTRRQRASSDRPGFGRFRSAPHSSASGSGSGAVLDRPPQSYLWSQSELKTHHRAQAPYVSHASRANLAGDLMSPEMNESSYGTQMGAMDDRLAVIHQTAKALRRELVLKHSGGRGGGVDMYDLDDVIDRQEAARTEHLIRYAGATLTGEGGPRKEGGFEEQDDELDREARALQLAIVDAEEQERLTRVIADADLEVAGEEEEPVKQAAPIVQYQSMRSLPQDIRVPAQVRRGEVADESEARRLLAVEVFNKLNAMIPSDHMARQDTRLLSPHAQPSKKKTKRCHQEPAPHIKRLFEDTKTKDLTIQQLQAKLKGALTVLEETTPIVEEKKKSTPPKPIISFRTPKRVTEPASPKSEREPSAVVKVAEPAPTFVLAATKKITTTDRVRPVSKKPSPTKTKPKPEPEPKPKPKPKLVASKPESEDESYGDDDDFLNF